MDSTRDRAVSGGDFPAPEYTRSGTAIIADGLHLIGFSLAGAVALVSPWLFASWEMWWFWSVVVVLCTALACSGAGTILDEALLRPNHLLRKHVRHVPTRAVVALASCVPFLAYALLRCIYPSGPRSPMVAMERERSLMLFFTPVALGIVHLLSSRTTWRALLLRLLIADFVLLCVCAVATHFANGDTQILWVANNDFHYIGRASAPFYCPNNFVDLASAALCLMVATALTPRIKFRTLLPVLLGAAFFAFSGFLTLSRGGVAATVAALAVGVALFGFLPRPPWARAVFGIIAAIAVAGGATAIRYTDNPLMKRLSSHGLWNTWTQSESIADFRDKAGDAFWFGFDRGQYIGAALRAWKSNPIWGIGPGQHSNRWAEFEASDDAVRPTKPDLSDMVRPRQRDYLKHLYEVHSDWTQLLEEYGVVGVVLFLVPAVTVFVLLLRRIVPCADGSARTIDRALPLGTALWFLSLSFHMVFDFSLQMPALTWLIATLVALSLLSEGDAVA